MKFKLLASLFLTFGIIYLFSGFKSQEGGQLYFMRSTNNVGSMIAYKVFIDDTVVCHLKNKHYSVHNLSAGEHTVSIQNGGLGGHTKSRPIKINIQQGKANYVVAINGPDLYLQEVVETSAKELLKKIVITNECLPAKEKK
ncbi:MAG: DUF2846 domain-containing protein [Bacteroidota bacterium]